MGKAKELAELGDKLTVTGSAVTVSGFNYDNIVDSAPGALNTLNELAAAIGDDANFSTTVTNSIATKLPLAGGTLTGNLAHTGNLTIDVVGDITLDAGGGDILLKDDGAHWASIYTNGTNTYIQNMVNSGDLYLSGKDGSGNGVNALVLDMSNLGFASFNANAFFNESASDVDFRIKSVNETNMFYVDASTDRIGIGTASPLHQLHVKASGNGKIRFEGNANTNLSDLLISHSTSGDSGLQYNSNQLNMFTYGAITFNAGTGNISGNYPANERMRIASDGKVGIGTNNPSYKLHTLGSDAIQAWFQSTHADTCQIQLSTATTNSYARITNNAGTLIYESDITSDNADSGHRFKIDGTERMRIDSTGRLFLGPDAADIQIDPASTNSGINLLYMRGNASGDKAEISLNHYGYHNYHIGAGLVGNGKFSIGTAQTASSFVMDTSGNVGIGTTSPSVNFEVNTSGNTFIHVKDRRSGSGLYLKAASNGDSEIQTAGGNNDIGLRTSGNLRMKITSSGDVKIGNLTSSASSAPLFVAKSGTDVQAIFGDNNSSIDDPSIRIIGRNTANSAIRYTYLGLFADENYGYLGYNAGAGAFSYALNFNTSGQVGIGTSNPTTYAGANGGMVIYRPGASSNAMLSCVNTTGSGQMRQIDFFQGTSTGRVGSIESTTTFTNYNSTSDRRLKENIMPIQDATQKILAMNPVSHTWINDKTAPAQHGFIAQEMQSIVPEAVSGDADSEEMMQMDYGKITPVIVKSLQDALKEISSLKQRISELEKN